MKSYTVIYFHGDIDNPETKIIVYHTTTTRDLKNHVTKEIQLLEEDGIHVKYVIISEFLEAYETTSELKI